AIVGRECERLARPVVGFHVTTRSPQFDGRVRVSGPWGLFMSTNAAGATERFADYLRDRHHQLNASAASSESQDGSHGLRRLWEQRDLPANEFADEVARFYDLPRLQLPRLLAAAPLLGQFSRRFLRDMAAFPYRSGDGQIRLALADPTDTASVRAAEIVLGSPIAIDIASFEDLATALTERLGDDAGTTPDGEAAHNRNDDDIESLRDLASGAPVVRGVKELLEKDVELRASDIHLAPSRSGLIVRMRIDGLLRAVPAPADALPQAVISRIKIMAGLNIAERRLPQDGAARLRVAKSELDIRVAIMPT